MKITARHFNQIRPGICPAIACTQSHRCAVIHAILLELNRNELRSQIVAVTVIIPGFANYDLGTGENALNTGNREGVLFAINRQIGRVVGRIVDTLAKAGHLNIQRYSVSKFINMISYVIYFLCAGIRQRPVVGFPIPINEGRRCTENVNAIRHGVCGNPASAA